VLRERFDEYIRRFNAEDTTAFEEFLHPEMRMQNGLLVFHGVQGMKDHYARIWGRFRESLTVERFVSDDVTVAVQLWAHFEALGSREESLFGPVTVGDCFDFRGLIMYRLGEGDLFTDIKVAYNSFTFTGTDGTVRELGAPH